MTNWENAGQPPSGKRPGEGEVIAHDKLVGDITRYLTYVPMPDAVGDIEALPMWAGQGVSMVRNIQPAADIVREINVDAEAILYRLAG